MLGARLKWGCREYMVRFMRIFRVFAGGGGSP